MTTIFVDTSFVVALLDVRDADHTSALELLDEVDRFRHDLLSTDAVIIEIGNFFSRTRHRQEAIEWIEEIRRRDTWEIVPLDRPLVLAGEARFRRFADKTWSLTDCISMEAMRRRRVKEIATTDRHFEQAGFRVLL